MDSLFDDASPSAESTVNANSPLADILRPTNIDDIVGQEHLLSADGPLRRVLSRDVLPSLIFWGPPGTGKTSLATAIARHRNDDFYRLSAIESGVKEVRDIIARAQKARRNGRRTILFIDEIHRFSKSQQDALLHAVETGVVALIGATTENPSFEVNPALISRSRVYRLHPLSQQSIETLVRRALNYLAQTLSITYAEPDIESLYRMSGGDARSALNIVEFAASAVASGGELVLDRHTIQDIVQQRLGFYDKSGEGHYDTISAFIKTMRGSDPNAALFWLAKMLEAGEDPKFIARRMVVFASEDIGNAEPQALQVAVACFQAVELIGMPECRINLGHAVTFLACAPKSNASYVGIEKALALVRNGADTTVPLHLRNAPTSIMKNEGFGQDYKYPHDYPEHFLKESYWPDGMPPQQFYEPANQGREAEFRRRMEKFWGNDIL